MTDATTVRVSQMALNICKMQTEKINAQRSKKGQTKVSMMQVWEAAMMNFDPKVMK